MESSIPTTTQAMSYLLEQIRATHELVQTNESMICAVLDDKPKGQKAKVSQQHAVSQLVDEIVTKNSELKRLYEDCDGLLKEELAVVGGPNMFNSYYDALNATRAYHSRFPSAVSWVAMLTMAVKEKQ